MRTVKHAAPAAGTAPLAESAAIAREMIAREHSALFPTRLALARWTKGGDVPHVPGAGGAAPALRAAWYACATRDFQEWIDCGGFAQHDDSDAATDSEPSVPVAEALRNGPVPTAASTL